MIDYSINNFTNGKWKFFDALSLKITEFRPLENFIQPLNPKQTS